MSILHGIPGASPSAAADDHNFRSRYMERLILEASRPTYSGDGSSPPRLLVQYWNDSKAIPSDVQLCIESWAPLEKLGFDRLLFDDTSATQFIVEHFGADEIAAFARCSHPAMRADYFRMCFMLERGGFYVDADDVFQEQGIESLLDGNALKLQPLCYDLEIDSMVNLRELVPEADGSEHRIFYVNNNPLIAPPHHPVIARALARSTAQLTSFSATSRDIQAITGPGNLTASLVAYAIELAKDGHRWDFQLLTNWADVAVSRWPLAYRADDRNWRNWVSKRPSANFPAGAVDHADAEKETR